MTWVVLAFLSMQACLLIGAFWSECWQGLASAAGWVLGARYGERVLLFELRCRLTLLRHLAQAIGDSERRLGDHQVTSSARNTHGKSD